MTEELQKLKDKVRLVVDLLAVAGPGEEVAAGRLKAESVRLETEFWDEIDQLIKDRDEAMDELLHGQNTVND